MSRPATILTVLLVTVCAGVAPAAETQRPLLVTIDDLPVAGGSLHVDTSERESYPDRAAMGSLSFEIINLEFE